MRDLGTEAIDTNGHRAEVPEMVDDGLVRRVKRDKKLADVALMMIDAAAMLDPLVTLVSSKLLRWVALGAAVGLAFQALREPTYERAAILAVFMILVRVMLGKG